MIGCLLAPLIMAALPGVSAVNSGNSPTRIEVFTTTDQSVVDVSVIENQHLHPDSELQIYRLDGIQQVEGELSGDLPKDPETARWLALQHIQQLDEQTTASIQNAAVGLAKAMQYRVDRYPAIVFDGKVVVYGLTDLSAALDHYQKWLVGARP
ncbi:MAG: TIGR03757 family integrating conjugative element protein [Candidatus Sedimenticola sp. 6PFRAG7]